VHDVAPTVQALAVAGAIGRARRVMRSFSPAWRFTPITA
jgi:hypothetical protein